MYSTEQPEEKPEQIFPMHFLTTTMSPCLKILNLPSLRLPLSRAYRLCRGLGNHLPPSSNLGSFLLETLNELTTLRSRACHYALPLGTAFSSGDVVVK